MHTVLQRHGVSVAVNVLETVPEEGLVDWMTDTNADLAVGCSGEMLRSISPHLARDLSKQFADEQIDPESEEGADTTYDQLVSTLPPAFAATDRSASHACADAVDSGALSQSVVPVYRKTKFSRESKKLIADAARVVTTGDIEDMTEELKNSSGSNSDVAAIVGNWYDEQGSKIGTEF